MAGGVNRAIGVLQDARLRSRGAVGVEIWVAARAAAGDQQCSGRKNHA